MSNMLSDGAAYLACQLGQAAATAFTVTRGAASIPLTGTKGSYTLKFAEPNGGFRIVHTDADFIFPVAAYVFGGVVSVPQPGDQFAEVGADGVTRTYVAMSYGGGEKCYRYADPFRNLLRVHTKATSGGA